MDEVAKRMHITTGTARNRMSRGLPMPPSIKIVRRRLFPEHEFDKWMIGHLITHEDVSLS